MANSGACIDLAPADREQIYGDGEQGIDGSSSNRENDQVDAAGWQVSARSWQENLESIDDNMNKLVEAASALGSKVQPLQALSNLGPEVETGGESSDNGSKLKRRSANQIDARKKLKAVVAELSQSSNYALDARRYLDDTIKGSDLANPKLPATELIQTRPLG
ncbi:hypothetical protein FAUST_8528 [Fusarium austroamericanum]|uniref:Uncharacterized protein n=1 Tax=Fusarium austroamericanum TaxID=282268 RepID=A0AAN5Z4D5_FUSAU|nr:hypothetical protein FAUST_8528 [Fusarium austroamericanum]